MVSNVIKHNKWKELRNNQELFRQMGVGWTRAFQETGPIKLSDFCNTQLALYISGHQHPSFFLGNCLQE